MYTGLVSTTLGYQDDGSDPEAVQARASGMKAGWMRIIVTTKSDPAAVAARMRNAQAAGMKTILTIGGTGTQERKPTVAATRALIASLPRATKYTWTNEPDLAGKTPANYGRGWKQLRKVLGRRLLWGDFSPHNPVGYTQAAQKAVKLKGNLDFAVHPYQFDVKAQGNLDNLAAARRQLAKGGIKANYWLTEFGYKPEDQGNWAAALAKARNLKARNLVAYDVGSPAGWNTKLSDESYAALAARNGRA